MPLPIKRVTLYKHGLGFFERRGAAEGEVLRLEFPRPAMDDILKSLVVIDAVGQVLGVEFETPPDRNPQRHRGQLQLSDSSSLTDTLTALRGRQVRLSTSEQTLEGVLIGVDLEGKNRLERALLSLYQPEARRVIRLPLDRLDSFEILDPVAAGDLEFALQSAKRDEDRAGALLRLSEGAHELSVSYIAPAPAWRVSYRVIAEQPAGGEEGEREIYLQGWGLFDNTLEEDLEGVELSLMAGMPVSFRYALFAPNTPERPLVHDEERTVNAPIEYAGLAAVAVAGSLKRGAYIGEVHEEAASMNWMEQERGPADQMAQSVQHLSSGEDCGALFAYKVARPVSVARGQSGMVPLLSASLKGRRELLYNYSRHAEHPVAGLRFGNASGLTLERGPVTVLEGRDYAGEAVLGFTPVGAEVILAFSVELGVRVNVQMHTEMRTEQLSIEQGYLLVQAYQVHTTVYEVASRLSTPVTLTLEHSRLAGAELDRTPTPDCPEPECPEPEWLSLTEARWRLEVPAQTSLEFVVAERTLHTRREQISEVSSVALKAYLDGRFLDAATYQALSGVRALYGQIGAARTTLHKLDTERHEIGKRQGQIQGNLKPLARDGDEGKLRSRLVRELGDSETRLAMIGTEIDEVRAQIVALEAQAAQAIAALAGGQ